MANARYYTRFTQESKFLARTAAPGGWTAHILSAGERVDAPGTGPRRQTAAHKIRTAAAVEALTAARQASLERAAYESLRCSPSDWGNRARAARVLNRQTVKAVGWRFRNRAH